LSASELFLLVTRTLRITLLDHQVLTLLHSLSLVHLVLQALRKSSTSGLEAVSGTSLIYLLRQSTDLLLPSIARLLG